MDRFEQEAGDGQPPVLSAAELHNAAQKRYYRTLKGRETQRRWNDKRRRAYRVANIEVRRAELDAFYRGG